MSEGVQGLLTPLTAAIFAITFYILWSREPARRSTLAMAVGYTFLSLGFFISQLTPASLGRANVALTNVPYAIGCIVMVWGILERSRIQTPIRTLTGIAVLGSGLGIVSLLFGDSVEADLYIANTTYGLIFGVAAVLLSQRDKSDLIEKVVLALIILNVAQMFMRPPLSFMFGAEIAGDYRDSGYYIALQLVMALGSMVLGLSLIAACIKDQFNAVRDDFATDKLSGLLSRRAFEARVRETMLEAEHKNVPVSLVIGDIDHFKQVNDIWGHQIGDNAIEAFGALVLGTVRGTDVCGRVGGEEFCILVWNAKQDVAQALAERLRVGVTGMKVTGMDGSTHLTASFGTAELEPEETYHKLFSRADNALYRAKDAGRNKVAVAGDYGAQYGRRKDDALAEEHSDPVTAKVA